MKVALVGHGRMGREIERVAAERGHRIAAVLPRGRWTARSLRGIDVAFEFTEPSAAEANVVALLEHGVAVVCGTTGWDASSPAVLSAVKRSKAGAVVAPNFSVGVALFGRVVREAARAFASIEGYDPYVIEVHHRAKVDAPSGTASSLASIVSGAGRSTRRVRAGMPDGPLSPGDVPVASVRAGREPGTHTVGFDGVDDAVTLTHRSRGRAAFATGAVLAAEWLQGRRGLHRFEEVVDGLVREGKGGRK